MSSGEMTGEHFTVSGLFGTKAHMSSGEITGEHFAVSGIIIWYKSVVLSLIWLS